VRTLIFSIVVAVGCFSPPVRRACRQAWRDLTLREKLGCLVGR